MKARIWKAHGLWEYDVQNFRRPMRATGRRLTWQEALNCALEELRWMARS